MGINEPKRNDELSGPRMSEIDDLHSFWRSAYATEIATTTVAALPIQSMLLKVQCTTLPCPELRAALGCDHAVSCPVLCRSVAADTKPAIAPVKLWLSGFSATPSSHAPYVHCQEKAEVGQSLSRLESCCRCGSRHGIVTCKPIRTI